MLDLSAPKRSTRTRLLDVAEAAVLAKGFSATSIEELIAAVGITKSGFFYHFKDKTDLARALMHRYLEQDNELLEGIFVRADELNEDPLHGLLVCLKFVAEMMGDVAEAHPGCLTAAFTYQDQLFSQDIRDLNATGLMRWRLRFRERFELIAARYPPRIDVDFESLADMAVALIEGGLILNRALNDPKLLARQVLLYRDFIRLVFTPATDPAVAGCGSRPTCSGDRLQ
jgi:TetR/AcrR family transcriptional regulator, transcriptional repressor for nem operon